MDRVELLSPAGSYDCFLAALNGGADAVYLGLDRFGARASAVNLSYDELRSALDLAHNLGRKIYLTVNTLFKDNETAALYDFLKDPYEWGLDGVIVQDIGVMSIISRTFPELPIHVSTQAAVTAAEGAKALTDLGIKRIVPARELSLVEISKLIEKCGLEIECFIHGSMCYSYSGKCLMSSFIGGRSGNRGRCAQPCRLSYDGQYPLSLKDMCTIDMIPELIKAGISSFKIEGRMKSSGYVYGVTSVYRKYIDMFYDLGKYEVDPSDRDRLISIYTRSGNCNGYYIKRNGRDMITLDNPSYRSDPDDDPANVKVPQADVEMSVEIKAGNGAVVTVGDREDSITVTTGIVPEKAINQALTKDVVTRQLSKSGGTCFRVNVCDVKCEDGLFLTNAALNSIRRCAIDTLFEHKAGKYRRTAAKHPEEGLKGRVIKPSDEGDNDSKSIHEVVVSIENIGQLQALLDTDADSIVIPFSLLEASHVFDKYDFSGRKVYVRLPYVVRDDERCGTGHIKTVLKDICASHDIKGIYVSNLESVTILKEIGYSGDIIGDIHLYAYNREAVGYLKELGVTRFSVPVELNLHELDNRQIHGEELIVYGRLPMMISAGCIYNTYNGCKKDRYGHDMYITDRKNKRLFVKCDCNTCTNVIYNSVKLDITDEKSVIEHIRPASVRFDFTDESGEELKRIINSYYDPECSLLISERTKGHLRRGID